MNTRFVMSLLLGAALLVGSAALPSAAHAYENPAGHTPPGLEKQDKVPPGQAKKMDEHRKDRKYKDGKRHDRHDRDDRYDGDRRHDRDRDKHYDGDRRHDRDRDGKRDGVGIHRGAPAGAEGSN